MFLLKDCFLIVYSVFYYFFCVFFLLRSWEKGLQYFSISKKDSVKGKNIKFHIFIVLPRTIRAISKNIFSIIQLNNILKRHKMFFYLFVTRKQFRDTIQYVGLHSNIYVFVCSFHSCWTFFMLSPLFHHKTK